MLCVRRDSLTRVVDSLERLDDQNFVAFVDTNVILDLLSCHDNFDAVQNGGCYPEDAYRLQRAGQALRLAIHLFRQRATPVPMEHARAVLK